jgi:hypothetical protein
MFGQISAGLFGRAGFGVVAVALAGCATVEPDPASPARVRPQSQAVETAQPVSAESSFADDTLLLLGMLEGWAGDDVRQTNRQLGNLFFDLIQQSFPDIPEGELRAIVREYEPRIANLCRARASGVFLKHFTHQEVREILAFYRSPVGRAYARAYPEIVQEMGGRDPLRDALVHEIGTRIRTQRLERTLSRPSI